jgi:uncharacterized membrane protein YccC
LNTFSLISPSAAVRQGIKTGLAGLIAYAIYLRFHLYEGYWAVFTALVVTQANLGAFWQAALYRTIGTTVGAISAALLASLIGPGPIRTGILLFVLAAVFAEFTTRHPSFSAAGFTAAVVLFFSHPHDSWKTAWLRVLYTIMGALIAFVVGMLVWPVRAREGLRLRIVQLLEDCERLTRLVTQNALHGDVSSSDLDQLGQSIVLKRRAITTSLEEVRDESTFSRFDYGAYVSLIEVVDHIRHRLLSMGGDAALYANSGLRTGLVPSLPNLCEAVANCLQGLADAIRNNKGGESTTLTAAVSQVESELHALRESRATAPLALDHMLPFWSFVFNLMEIAESVVMLEAKSKALFNKDRGQ